jgi:hypothetical protein
VFGPPGAEPPTERPTLSEISEIETQNSYGRPPCKKKFFAGVSTPTFCFHDTEIALGSDFGFDL